LKVKDQNCCDFSVKGKNGNRKKEQLKKGQLKKRQRKKRQPENWATGKMGNEK